MLAAAARHLERLRREHQETAGEERDHGKHIEVDAVGARWIAACPREGLDGRDVHPRRQQLLNAFGHDVAVRPWSEMHIEAVQLTEASEAPLGGGDIGECGESLEIGDAGNVELDHPLADDEAQLCVTHLLRGKR
jgi:hypothetical protein